jgi:hypothetical protein
MASISYYTLNLEQNFSFPHDNADTYTDEQLWAHYSGKNYLCAYLIRQLGHNTTTILDALAGQPYAKDYAAAWMRLKFLCEVMEPTRILRKRDAMPPKAKARLQHLSIWTAESLTEEFYQLEVVTNVLGQHLFDVVKNLTEGVEPPVLAPKFTDAVLTFNKKLYALRQNPLDQHQWNLWNPNDLTPFAWASYIMDAKAASSCLTSSSRQAETCVV